MACYTRRAYRKVVKSVIRWLRSAYVNMVPGKGCPSNFLYKGPDPPYQPSRPKESLIKGTLVFSANAFPKRVLVPDIFIYALMQAILITGGMK